MSKAVLYRIGQSAFDRLRRALAPAFASELVPLRHLGSLTIFFFWIVLVSGIWLFLYFRTSVTGAYDSVEYLTHEQWYLGGVMRSLHRYASDAAIVTLVLHILKELSYDHYRGKRWFSWITGIPLLWLVIPLGITGYWLVWDELAQYVALSSAELLDRLPVFTDPMARNFLSAEGVSDRFFTLMAFLHLIGLPLLLVFGIWLHVFRINAPKINPPRTLMAGALLAMLVLSLVYPAQSHGPADLARVPDSLGLDWFYLLVYPLIQAWSPGAVWLLLIGISLLLLVAPWLPPARHVPVAVVDLDNCNGCERCVNDCPFGAVAMGPRSDGKAYAAEAVVDPALCVSCGICVGACPTATPFRTRTALVPGIDLPEPSAVAIREALHVAADRLRGPARVVSLCCEGSRASRELREAGNPVVDVKCMAHVPPPYVDFVLARDVADGVLLAGCAGGDCQYRLGADWTRQRMEGERDPMLRKRVERRRIALGWQPPWASYASPVAALEAFRRSLAGDPEGVPPVSAGSRIGRWLTRGAALAATLGVFLALVGWFSSSPRYRLLAPGEAVVSLSFSHAGQRIEECRTLTQDELNALPPNMRTLEDCPRERRPVHVAFSVDGQTRYDASLPPTGIWDDGESNVYARMRVRAGTRRLFVGMSDSGRAEGLDRDFDYQREAEVTLEAGQHLLVEFDDMQQTFVFR